MPSVADLLLGVVIDMLFVDIVVPGPVVALAEAQLD
jgi:hypothetical protein